MAIDYDKSLREWLNMYRPDDNLEFNFLHYENAGELVGGYKYTPLVIKDGSEWVEMPDPSHPPSSDPLLFPLFFNQDNIRLRKIIERGTTNTPEEEFINYRTRWIEPFDSSLTANYTPYIRIKHINLGDGNSRIESADGEQLIGKQEIYFGEFFFLGNTCKSIKRVNIKTELLQSNNNHEYLEYLNGDFEYPDDTILGKYDSFMEWYLGYGPVPEAQRPEFLSIPKITPTPCNLIHTESRRRWNGLRGECLSWIRIYDKSNINKELKNISMIPQSMIGQVKCIIDFEKIKDYLDKEFNYDEYPVDNYVNYDIIFYPLSMYMYPANAIVDILEPNVNSLNSFVDRVIFEAPSNFKTDGNFHYKIEFYTFSIANGPIFTTSSYEGSSFYEPEGWFFSEDDQKNWSLISNGLPTFDNMYEPDNGTDSSFTSHIRYILSKDIFEKVKNNPMIIFKIYQMDGTLVHSNANDFSLAYNINIT